MSNDNYAHGWSIFFTRNHWLIIELSKCSWDILYEFPNITKYICEDFSSKQNENNTAMIIRQFYVSITWLRLYLNSNCIWLVLKKYQSFSMRPPIYWSIVSISYLHLSYADCWKPIIPFPQLLIQILEHK